jgi:23S rRNA pseudouridine1911/1915/1917 synthase
MRNEATKLCGKLTSMGGKMKSEQQNEQIFEISVTENMAGERIDVALSNSLEEVSRNYIQRLIEAGSLQLNGEVCNSKKIKVSSGDSITLTLPEPEAIEAKPENIAIDIVYEDDEILIINKEKGMVVHPAPGNESGTLVNAIMYHCKDKLSSINGKIRPGIVHRIDKDTSGLIVIAKSDFTHRALAEQLASHTITRIYEAVVYHNFIEDEGKVDAPIGRDPKNRLRNAVTELNSRKAVTHYKVLERFGKFTHIEVRLETGRTHQIRVHMAHIKHPLLGDQLYGPNKKVFGAETQVLHAKTLGFVHPKTGEYIEFTSELPAEFQNVLDAISRKKTGCV